MTATKQAAAVPATIGAKIDARMKLVEQKDELNAQLKVLQAQIDELEGALLTQMDKEGTTNAGGKLATTVVSESVVPQVEDWDSFYKFIHRLKYYHLLERRPSVTGCRELFEKKGAIPGVQPFLKRTLRFTSKKG